MRIVLNEMNAIFKVGVDFPYFGRELLSSVRILFHFLNDEIGIIRELLAEPSLLYTVFSKYHSSRISSNSLR